MWDLWGLARMLVGTEAMGGGVEGVADDVAVGVPGEEVHGAEEEEEEAGPANSELWASMVFKRYVYYKQILGRSF